MILKGETPADLAAAWKRATALIDHHADEISPALRQELLRFLKLAEGGLLHGKTFDLEKELSEHERRVTRLMTEGMEMTGRAFGSKVLRGVDQGGNVGEWLRKASVASALAGLAKDGARRFRNWTQHHLLKTHGLTGERLEREFFRQRVIITPRRSTNAAEDRAHLASQWATDSAALFSGAINARVWLSRLDGLERSTHNEAHAQHCPMSGSFTVGGYQLRFPRDPRGPVHEIAGCRCITALRRRN